ncbi:MAG: hypothetical protein ACI4PG_06160 [Candidatus Ventricola sp.]
MIEASFDADRSAAVSGAYQHDRGQRLQLRGLPPPDVLAQMDELIACDTVTVQAQFAFVGDSQTETRLALWNEEQGVWTAAVPDVYMTRCEDVHVYVYVDYGQDEDGQRAKTCYEAVFRPAGRPAPSDSVTPGQVNAWDALVQEVNLAIAGTNTAASRANGEATAAREATERANAAADAANAAADDARETASAAATEAADTANQAAGWLRGIAATATTLAPGEPASAVLLSGEAGPVLAIGVPEGIRGSDGRPGVATINGITVTNEGSVTLTAEDVGARPAEWTPSAQDVGAVSMELLWENADTTASFVGSTSKQEVIIEIADILSYDGIFIEVQYTVTADGEETHIHSAFGKAVEGNTIVPSLIWGNTGNYVSRQFKVVEGGLRVDGCYRSGSSSANNKYEIPVRIYGVKGVSGHA